MKCWIVVFAVMSALACSTPSEEDGQIQNQAVQDQPTDGVIEADAPVPQPNARTSPSHSVVGRQSAKDNSKKTPVSNSEKHEQIENLILSLNSQIKMDESQIKTYRAMDEVKYSKEITTLFEDIKRLKAERTKLAADEIEASPLPQ